jgi:hypothetical protein
VNWLGALQAVAESVLAVFAWKTGGRTQAENALRQEIEQWRKEYHAALAGGDVDRANFCLRELRRVRDQARSQAS